MPNAHSKLSPSSASRWLACPGSLQFASHDSASEYAAEGTVAHALAHQCWMLGVPPSQFLGSKRTCDGFVIEVNEEMTEAVQLYLDVVDEKAAGKPVVMETKIEHSMVPGFGGTIDCTIPHAGHIIDFKYGAGLTVNAVENLQLGCYALLYRDHFQRCGDIDITIVQPRAGHADGPVRTWTAPGDWLADLMLQILEVADGDRDDQFAAGDHCRWCPAKAQCPVLYELTLQSARSDFKEISLEESMTAEKAIKILAIETAVKSYFDAVGKWVHNTLERGGEVPGFKLVDTYGNRRYAVGEDDVVRQCKNAKFGKKQIYKTELLSPAQLEKVVGKPLVTSLVERPHTGTKVVPDSDGREAVKRLTAAQEFANCDSVNKGI